MKKILISILVILTFVSTSFAFSDENNFSWAKDAINKWSSKGYVSGYPDGTFRGNNYITRAEVITIINKLNNSKIEINKRASKDINLSDWFFYDMSVAVETGLISVNDDGNLRPKEYATREDVMVILSKLFNVIYSGNANNAKVKQFLDCNEITSNEYKRVAGIVEEGFVSGYKDGTLRPKANITRAEFICVLNNAIQEIVSDGDYNNKALVGNIVINGENVKITNSEIQGKIFILDGARNNTPILINTKVSRGINSRVGEILIKNVDELKTVTEYNDDKIEYTPELAFAKLKYSETEWTNDDVKVTINIDEKYVPLKGSNKIIFERNGEKEIEFENNGNIVRIKAKVSNIDKIAPKVTATAQCNSDTAIITVNFEDDGLSPITEIDCSNGMVNKLDKETNILDNVFIVTANGTYTITVKDEAGNKGRIKLKVADIGVVEENIVVNNNETQNSEIQTNTNETISE